MSTAMSNAAVESKSVRYGFDGVRCLLCGETDTVSVTLSDTTVFHCSSCDNDYSVQEVKKQIQDWAAVVNWVLSAPKLPSVKE